MLVGNIGEILQTTLELMQESNINIRDTWFGYHNAKNLDDFYLNGNKYHGPKSIRITLKDDGYTDINANKIYCIPGYKCAAYDNYEIRVPKRLSGLVHPIIHEAVHFLQENTTDSDKSYIKFTGNNFNEYLNQRSELEAHFIQLKYIYKNEMDRIQDDFVRAMFEQQMKQQTTFDSTTIKIIQFSKTCKII